MRHYSLWLDKYERRRAQILSDWGGLAREVADASLKIPHELLFHELSPIEPDSGMCFVDGGEGLRELLGVGAYFIRASGLVLSCDSGNGELFVRELDMNLMDYDDHIKERVELLRDGMEYDVALRCVEEHKPGILFMDGSLYVKARRKPLNCLEYEFYRKKYNRLLKTCKKEGVRLVGVSEDSKSRLFMHHLSGEYKVKFPKHMTDSTILRILSKGGSYRTQEFTPPTGLETGEPDGLGAGFPTAYLQPAETANPLRVDVPAWETDFNGILSLIAGLCRGSGHYGYPIPLYLAHMDAHIPPSQMDWTVRQLVSYISKHDARLASTVLKPTRRTERPE
jgi:hypothetical protein